ncbi:hypothetical protein NL676_005155 [Syzygium grande]|nr:hypothetical protein NL676_005155 [Syzygium grande]
MGKAAVTPVDSCPSCDSSRNVSATPDHGGTACKLPVLAHDAAKDKMEVDEQVGETSGAAEARLSLDLTLMTPSSGHSEPLSSNGEAVIKGSSPLDDGERHELPPADKVFACTYCKKCFKSSQALGGHQNAHRHERLITKRQQELAALSGYGPPSTLTYGYRSFNSRYSDVHPFPALGPLNRLALPRVGMDQPMIRRLQKSWNQPGSQVMQKRPSLGHPHMMASPLSRMEGMPYAPNNSYNNFNDAGFLGQFRAPPPPASNHYQQGGGGMMHSCQGPSSILGPNVGMRTVADGWGSSGKGGGSSGVLLGKRDDQLKTVHGELDLTLKL